MLTRRRNLLRPPVDARSAARIIRTLAALSATLLPLGPALAAAPLPVASASSAAASSAPPAARSSAGPVWSKLTTQQQAVLAPLRGEWHAIDASRKRKWLDIADRYPSLPPEEQKRIAERMAEWARLSPLERAQARLNYQQAKQLSPLERQARWEEYQALPESERQALAAKAKKPGLGVAAAPAASGASQAAARAASAPAVRPVAPTVVQVQPGATTTLMSHKPVRPLAVAPGAPKIVSQPAQVDPATLLPRTGPQAAPRAVAASAAK